VPFSPAEFAPATMQYVLAAVQTARSLGYDVLVVTDQEGTAGIARVTESNLVDGLILMDIKRHDERIASLAASGRPGVLIGFPDGECGIDAVDLDFAAAGEMLTRHLFDHGHREVIFLTLPDQVFAADLGYAWRFRGAAVATAAALGMTLRLVECEADPLERAATLRQVLGDRGGATALLVHNDAVVAELPRVLGLRGLAVPEDLAVVSLFSDQFARMFSVPYTAIETSAAQAAACAVHLLAERVDAPERPVVRDLLAPTIIDRGTS
jgi:DNA-binding LacI/PurR family transcriptional regulator